MGVSKILKIGGLPSMKRKSNTSKTRKIVSCFLIIVGIVLAWSEGTSGENQPNLTTVETWGETQIKVTWEPIAGTENNPFHYELYIDNHLEYFGKDLMYVARRLTPDTIYHFKLRSCHQDTNECTNYSKILSGTTAQSRQRRFLKSFFQWLFLLFFVLVCISITVIIGHRVSRKLWRSFLYRYDYRSETNIGPKYFDKSGDLDEDIVLVKTSPDKETNKLDRGKVEENKSSLVYNEIKNYKAVHEHDQKSQKRLMPITEESCFNGENSKNQKNSIGQKISENEELFKNEKYYKHDKHLESRKYFIKYFNNENSSINENNSKNKNNSENDSKNENTSKNESNHMNENNSMNDNDFKNENFNNENNLKYEIYSKNEENSTTEKMSKEKCQNEKNSKRERVILDETKQMSSSFKSHNKAHLEIPGKYSTHKVTNDSTWNEEEMVIVIDNSNIFIGAQECANLLNPKERRRNIRVKIQHLTKILERGRPLTQGFVQGSSPPTTEQVWEVYRRLGYCVDLEERRGKDEQRVDEGLHLNIYKALCDLSPRKLVIASGDGNKGKSEGATSLPRCARTALEKGWRVEVHSWQHSLSTEWLKLSKKYPVHLTIHLLDRYINYITFVDGKHGRKCQSLPTDLLKKAPNPFIDINIEDCQ